jgi:hypothetical protein
MRTLFAAALVLVVLTGCPSKPSTAETTLTTEEKGPALPVDHAPVAVDPTSREINRLSIAQLRGSLTTIFGNDLAGQPITWKVAAGNGLDVFAGALGEPDYIISTDEDLEPSPLYLKFIDDAARDVCERALTADFGRTDKASRALLRYVEKTDTVAGNPAGVDENLRYLLLRFHGVKVDSKDVATIAPLRSVFTQLATSGTEVKEGWRAVCVALVTAPEFHLY